MVYLDDQKKIVFDDKNFWEQESKFWSNYGKIYQHLEASTPYKKMLNDIKEIIINSNHKVWLDAGCGPGGMIDMIIKNVKSYDKIFGIDFDGVMIDNATKRLKNLNNIEIEFGDLSKPLKFNDGYFDAIIANLVLTYVIIFDGQYTGRDALKMVLSDMYRLLNKNGIFVWTTPVDNVNFGKVFLASWRQVFNPLTPKYIYYGPRILSYSSNIRKKGKKGIYHFLSAEELDKLMRHVGFKDVRVKKTFAKQAYLVSATK